MDFSPLYKHSTSHSTVLSPSASYLLTALSNRLILRSATSLKIEKSWTCVKLETRAANPSTSLGPRTSDLSLSGLSFSPRETHVAAYSISQNMVWVFSIHDADDGPAATMIAGGEGIAKSREMDSVQWSGDGMALIVWSDMGLRLSILALTAPPSPPIHIQFPKHGPASGWSFRPPDSKYFALIERHKGKDLLGIYDGVAWRALRHFQLSLTDAESVSWSPCGRYLAVWESPLEYSVHFYNPAGHLIGSFTPDQPNSSAAILKTQASLNQSLAKQQATTRQNQQALAPIPLDEGWCGLGIRIVRWHPASSFFAIGGYDEKVRVLNSLSWTPVVTLSHPPKISRRMQQDIQVWSEPADWVQKTLGRGIIALEPETLPYYPTTRKPDPNKATSFKPGIGLLEWSFDGAWLASRNDSLPHAVWIFQFLTSLTDDGSENCAPRLHSVVNCQAPVKTFRWNKNSVELAVACNTGAIIMWAWDPVKGERAEGVGIPSKQSFSLSSITYSQKGTLLLTDKDLFCLAYPVADDDDGNDNSYVANV